MQTFIISLGGSLINPGKPDIAFLKKFAKVILHHKDKQFVIICGGGTTAREYQQAAKKLGPVAQKDLDWIGIAATKLNAELLRSFFGPIAYERVVENPTEPPDTDHRIIVVGGWQPGCSTDMDAAYLAQYLDCYRIINMSNVDYVYDKDPKKYKNAKKFKKIEWKDFLRIVGPVWKPGIHAPFDPVASKYAAQRKMKVAVIGPSMKELDNLLREKEFKGTLIY